MIEPIEFTTEHIADNSAKEDFIFRDFLSTKEPYESLYKNNPWMVPPDFRKPLEWGTGGYWDTTVARKHEYWKKFDLPEATKDIHQMRRDFKQWGFCLIEDAMSYEQCRAFRERVLDQGEGEKLAKWQTCKKQQLCPSSY